MFFSRSTAPFTVSIDTSFHYSTYFSTRLDKLEIRDHEALSIIISLEDVECKDFDVFLSVIYSE